jgi:hypothetical protein
VRAVLLALLFGGITSGVEMPAPCFVEIPVYDATGNRLEVTVTEVSFAEGAPGIDLLTTSRQEYRVTRGKDRLYFSKRILGRIVELTLAVQAGMRAKKRVALMDCQQRTSLQYGELDSGADVRASSLKGRISGCQIVGDWWIRAMPMFGAHADPASYEGYIRPGDGSFWLTGSMRGERHIVVIGKDRQPIRAFGTDVVVGGENELGIVELGTSCPK